MLTAHEVQNLLHLECNIITAKSQRGWATAWFKRHGLIVELCQSLVGTTLGPARAAPTFIVRNHACAIIGPSAKPVSGKDIFMYI